MSLYFCRSTFYGATFQFVLNFLSYVSDKYNLNWFTVRKVITKIKRVNFLLRHSVCYFLIMYSWVLNPLLNERFRMIWFLPRCMQCRRCLAMRILSVCPFVYLSVKRVHYNKTEERSVQFFIPYERSFNLVFWEEKWSVRATPSTWNFRSTGPRWSEIADFRSLFARNDSAVTPSEKVQLTLIGSPLRADQWAQDECRTLSLIPQRAKVAQKRKVSKIWTISCGNFETVRDSMSVTIIH